MSLATLEKEIIKELREVTGNKKLTLKNLMEWSTGNVEVKDATEKLVYLPKLKINCAVVL